MYINQIRKNTITIDENQLFWISILSMLMKEYLELNKKYGSRDFNEFLLVKKISTNL